MAVSSIHDTFPRQGRAEYVCLKSFIGKLAYFLMLLTLSLHEYDGLSTTMSQLHLWPAASNRTNWFQVSRVWYSRDIVRSFFWFIQVVQECPWMNVYTVQLDQASEESRKELWTCQLVALLDWAKTAKTTWYSKHNESWHFDGSVPLSLQPNSDCCGYKGSRREREEPDRNKFLHQPCKCHGR